jgi:tetratricopeptide (TPR) repeat protein
MIAIFHSTGQAEEGLKEAAMLRRYGAADSDSLEAIAEAYLRGGMPDRSVPLYQKALDLDPGDDGLRAGLSFAASWARQYDLGSRVAESNPSRLSFQRMLNAVGARRQDVVRAAALETMRQANAFIFAMCWQELTEFGDMEAARRMWQARAVEFEGSSASLRNERVRIGLGIMYAALGQERKALDQIQLAQDANPSDPWTLFFSAEVHGLLGDGRRALGSLQQAFDRGFLSLHYLDHQFEHPPRGLYRYRNDPHFRALRNRLVEIIEQLRAQY